MAAGQLRLLDLDILDGQPRRIGRAGPLPTSDRNTLADVRRAFTPPPTLAIAPIDDAPADDDVVAQAAAQAIVDLNQEVIASLNDEMARRHTVGGRIGSGLGSYIESLWGFAMTDLLASRGDDLGLPPLELAWICENGYNDFALIANDAGQAQTWTPDNHHGEVLRAEIKSMALDAVESKAHFDATTAELGPHDLLVVLLWRWAPVPNRPGRVRPLVVGTWAGRALAIAQLRDALFVARGGTFVRSGECPDECAADCAHVGEPLNRAGTRERVSGPTSCVTGGVSFAGNFGGLVRMIKTTTATFPTLVERLVDSPECREYVAAIHSARPDAERNCFPAVVWARAAALLAVTADDEVEAVRAVDGYRDALLRAAVLELAGEIHQNSGPHEETRPLG